MKSERLDMNQVEWQGRISKVWAGCDGKVYVWLENRDKERTLLRLPEAQTGISVVKGEWVHVNGYLDGSQQAEPLSLFFKRGGRGKYLEDLPSLRAMIDNGVMAEHFQMAVIPTVWETTEGKLDDSVRVEGLVIRKWHYRDHYYLRMLVFDEHTDIVSTDENGVVHRQPHKVVAILPESFYKQVQIKQRIRISGSLVMMEMHERLKHALQQLNALDVAAQVPPEVLVFTISSLQLFIQVRSMIVFSR